MQSLSFLIEEFERGGTAKIVTPCVDSVPLTSLIADFEVENSWEPAGGYAGLVPAHFRFGSLDQYFLGNPESEGFISLGKIALLGCNCGEWGCWPLMAQVTIDEQRICWSDFEQPYRRERNYSDFGPFSFNPAQYLESLCSLIEQPLE